MATARRAGARDVFVNCPFDAEYHDTFRALIFAIIACGFRPRASLETDNGGETRLEKLYRIIEECRFGVHDLSRTELDPNHHLPRFNMPLELGLFLGARRYGRGKQRGKCVLILDRNKYRYQKFISDLAGVDPRAHGGRPNAAIKATRDWLGTESHLDLPGGHEIIKRYRSYRRALPKLALDLQLDPNTLTYADFLNLTTRWVMQDIQKP